MQNKQNRIIFSNSWHGYTCRPQFSPRFQLLNRDIVELVDGMVLWMSLPWNLRSCFGWIAFFFIYWPSKGGQGTLNPKDNMRSTCWNCGGNEIRLIKASSSGVDGTPWHCLPNANVKNIFSEQISYFIVKTVCCRLLAFSHIALSTDSSISRYIKHTNVFSLFARRLKIFTSSATPQTKLLRTGAKDQASNATTGLVLPSSISTDKAGKTSSTPIRGYLSVHPGCLI